MSGHSDKYGKIKNIVIALLVISAVFLGWKSRLFGNSSTQLNGFFKLFASITAGSENTAQAQAQTEASKPSCIVVTNAEGAHYGIKYDMDEIALYYGKTVLIFGEALGSAQEAEKVPETEWRKALTSCGVYFEYMSPVKMSVLDGWYGSEVSESWADFNVRRLCVTADSGKNRLYFLDEGSGEYYAADAAASERIAELTESGIINSAFFAFEISDAFESPDSYTLLILDDDGHPVIEAENPLTNEQTLKKVLINLGISEHEKSSYTDLDGTHFVDEGFTIRLSADGTLVYRLNKTEPDAANRQDESEVIELARKQIAETIAQTCGIDTGVCFYSMQRTPGGGYQVFFRYVVAGGEVYLYEDGYAASVTVLNGIVTEMELRFRSYSVTSETAKLLPEVQAAAAADGEFMLCYPDNGGHRLEPVWIASRA